MEHLNSILVARQVDQSKDENIGSATKESSSASALISSLVINGLIFLVLIGLFMILRNLQKRTYAPRSYVGRVPKEKQVDELPSGLFAWFKPLIAKRGEYILEKTNLDVYFFIRFLKVCTMICLVGCIITFPILFPVFATGGNKGSQLNVITYGNINADKANNPRFWAPCLVGIVFVLFLLFTIYRELMHFIGVRHAYMLSPLYADRISARTVLVTSIPDNYLNVPTLLKMFDNVARIWINTDIKELEDTVDERNKTMLKLEGAEVKYIQLSDKNRRAAAKKGTTPADADQETGSVGARWVTQKNRPSHKLKPLIGKKVDTITWGREELQRLNVKVKELQDRQRTDQVKQLNSAFIEFTTQAAAQTAVQCVSHNRPLHMAPRYIGVVPQDIIWSNMRIKWWERLVKITLTTAFLATLVIFWSVPVAIVGSISNIDSLTEKVKFLRFILKIPKPILGIITGFLPAILMAVLMALVPIIIRLMAKISGDPTHSEVELTTQSAYFAFQVVQVFLITTLGSAASASVAQIIKDPTSTTTLLAESIPKASNFYLSYLLLQGLAISAAILLQIASLIVMKLLGWLLDKTPRKKWNRWMKLTAVGWGTLFPIYTNLMVIAITYSVIAPLILFFAMLGMAIFWIAFKYNMLYVYEPNVDTMGKVYPRAIFHLFTGVYLLEICMIGLLAISRAFKGPFIVMIIALILTVLYHIALVSAFAPVINFLPRNLEEEEQALLPRNDSTQKEATTEEGAEPVDPMGAAQAPPKAGMFARFFKPHLYESYAVARGLLPKTYPQPVYTTEDRENAYAHPALAAKDPILWVPRDEAGVSKEEIEASRPFEIEMSDEFSWVDEKSKVQWSDNVDGVQTNPPDFEEKAPF